MLTFTLLFGMPLIVTQSPADRAGQTASVCVFKHKLVFFLTKKGLFFISDVQKSAVSTKTNIILKGQLYFTSLPLLLMSLQSVELEGSFSSL